MRKKGRRMVAALHMTTLHFQEQQMLCVVRKSLAIFVGVALATGLAAQDLKVRWDKGLKIQSSDKSMDFRIGGRIHNDWAFISNDASSGFDGADGAEFRRARLYIQARLWGNIEMKTQYDFEDGVADFKDVYMGLTGLPGNGKLRVGQHKEPHSLEQLASSNNITLMERSAMDGLVAGRQTGISYRGASGDKKSETLTYQIGVFRPSNGFGDSDANNSYNLAARLTGTPVARKGEQLLHLGVSASLREYEDGTSHTANREIHLGNRLVSAAFADADQASTYGLEAAWVQGPFSAQAEYSSVNIDSVSGQDPSLTGHYVQLAYTLTGEMRNYKNYDGVFGSITPSENYSGGSGGAWELALRYSGADFSDGAAPGATGNELTSTAVGVNWYLNPNARVMANYVVSDVDGSGAGSGEESSFQFRFQVNF